MSERRQFPRVGHKLLLTYDRYDAENLQDDEGIARTLNMSVRGLLLQLPNPSEVGTRLALTLALGDEIVEASGEVIHCEEADGGLFDTGVELKYVPSEYIEALERYFSKSD